MRKLRNKKDKIISIIIEIQKKIFKILLSILFRQVEEVPSRYYKARINTNSATKLQYVYNQVICNMETYGTYDKMFHLNDN